MNTCDSCGKLITVMAVLDSEDWEKIADGDVALCPECIDHRLRAHGLAAECDLQFVGGAALQSARTDRIERAGAWRPPERISAERVGLGSLYKGH